MATKTAASAKAGAAARSRSNGGQKAKTVTVRGVKLKVPATVKFRLLKDMVAARQTGLIDPVVDGLELILGEEEMEKVWDIDIAPGADGLQAAFGELLDEVSEKVLGAYGTKPGE
jgi:hypothetical protein